MTKKGPEWPRKAWNGPKRPRMALMSQCAQIGSEGSRRTQMAQMVKMARQPSISHRAQNGTYTENFLKEHSAPVKDAHDLKEPGHLIKDEPLKNSVSQAILCSHFAAGVQLEGLLR